LFHRRHYYIIRRVERPMNGATSMHMLKPGESLAAADDVYR
jgi:hypothetical protein